jgi:hypothetical protein
MVGKVVVDGVLQRHEWWVRWLSMALPPTSPMVDDGDSLRLEKRALPGAAFFVRNSITPRRIHGQPDRVNTAVAMT